MSIVADSPELRSIKEQMARQQVEDIRNTVEAARKVINPDRSSTPEQPTKNAKQILDDFAAGNFNNLQ